MGFGEGPLNICLAMQVKSSSYWHAVEVLLSVLLVIDFTSNLDKGDEAMEALLEWYSGLRI
jgi:hypothetical protein